MPDLFRRTLTLCALLLALIASSHAEERKLVIIHTNDFHGHIQQEAEYAGAARIAALVDEARRDNPGVLVLDAGDSVSGTPVSTLFKGLPIIEILSKVGYNAGALGNHEFDYGVAQIARFREAAQYPLLSANATTAAGDLIADAASQLMQVNGIRIGLIGLITDDTPDLITPRGNEGLVFASPETTLRNQVRALRPHADLIIVLSHLGHSEEKRLAAAVEGVDLIIGGHSHTRVDAPVKVNNTYVVQAARYGSHVGWLALSVDIDQGQLSAFQGRLLSAAELPAPSQAVATLVNQWEAQVENIVDVQIATSPVDYSRDTLQPLIEELLSDTANADFGYYNRGGIRDSLRAGPISIRHIWNIEPFGNNLVTVVAKGYVIRRMLAIDGDKHWRAEQIDDEKTYRVATNSWAADQAERTSPGQLQINDTGLLVRDVLVDHIRRQGLPAIATQLPEPVPE